MSKALNYLGIAKKAGWIETGEENTGIAVRSGKARLVILASDASDNARRRAEGYVSHGSIPLVAVPFAKAEISAITGKNGCSMAAILDTGLSYGFVSALEQEYGEAFSEVSELMKKRAEKAKQRAEGAKARRSNSKTGNRRSSV